MKFLFSVAFWLKSPLLLKLEWARLWLAGKEFTCFCVEFLWNYWRWERSGFFPPLVYSIVFDCWQGRHSPSSCWTCRLELIALLERKGFFLVCFVASLWTSFDFWQGRRSPASYLTSFSWFSLYLFGYFTSIKKEFLSLLTEIFYWLTGEAFTCQLIFVCCLKRNGLLGLVTWICSGWERRGSLSFLQFFPVVFVTGNFVSCSYKRHCDFLLFWLTPCF